MVRSTAAGRESGGNGLCVLPLLREEDSNQQRPTHRASIQSSLMFASVAVPRVWVFRGRSGRISQLHNYMCVRIVEKMLE